jgi:DNA polymerase I-like protein with 3'-5' exonuclease and polymerase domains
LKQNYLNEISKAKWYKDKKAIKERAEKDGLHIHDNTRFIDEAKRQCVNSRIQGSAADQTKIAIHNLYINKRLKELGWRTLLLVHDEIIGECPLIFAKECGELLCQCMIDAAKDLRTGAKCDATYVFRWYDDQFKEDIPVETMSQEEIEQLVVKCIEGRK